MSYRRSKETKRRLKKLNKETENSCCAGAYFDEDAKRYVKYGPNRGSGNTKFLKKRSNKRLRQSKELLNHGCYKKKYDYWWELF